MNALDRALAALRAPIPADFAVYFRRFLAWHVVFQVAFKQELHPFLRMVLGPTSHGLLPVVLAVLATAALAAWRASMRRGYLPGLVVLFVVKALACVGKYPVTANHAYLETTLLLVLIVFPSDASPGDRGDGTTDGLARNVICFATCSVWITAGLRKLIHGYWLSGEFLGYLLHFLAVRPAGITTRAYPAAFASYPLALPTWAPMVLVALAWAIIVGEVLIPLAVAWPRSRRVGLWFFTTMAVVISLVSGKVDFFFTNVMLILLFAPPETMRRWWKPWIVLNGVYGAISGSLGWLH